MFTGPISVFGQSDLRVAVIPFNPGCTDEACSVEFGEVFITTDPSGADIYINGVKKGTSPELFSRVPLGTIMIVARKGNLYGEGLGVLGDGFLPSLDELNLMYKNLHRQGLGGFAGDDYWSSSEDDDTYAWK